MWKMTFIIPRAGRNTAFWNTRTPDTVGPGSYGLSVPGTARSGSVPFSVGSYRPLSTLQPRLTPGPGAYEASPPPHRVSGTSSFRNTVQRPHYPVGVSSTSDAVTSPGPGAYQIPGLQEKPSFRRDYRRQKTLLLGVVPNPPSIPRSMYSEEKREMGPGCYHPSDDLIRFKGKSVDFAASKVKRSLWNEAGNESTPGPGQYNYKPRRKPTAAAVISRGKPKPVTEVNQTPGPGSYEPSKPESQSFSQKASFADKTGRQPLWTDRDSPGVGAYNLSAPPLSPDRRAQYAMDSGSNLHPGFLSALQRDCLKQKESDRAPGPGAYEALSAFNVQNYSIFVETGKVKFMTTQERFKGLFAPKEGPDPGQYDMQTAAKTGKARSGAPRFASYVKDSLHVSRLGDNETPAVGSYSFADPWTHSNSPVRVSNRSFDSSSVRFHPQELFPGERVKDIPGPGYYQKQGSRNKGEGGKIGKSRRFEGYGDYRREAKEGTDLGPGRYHQQPTLLRRSFNATTRVKDD